MSEGCQACEQVFRGGTVFALDIEPEVMENYPKPEYTEEPPRLCAKHIIQLEMNGCSGEIK